MAVAYSGFFLNLFNLLPISPLDGGRITAVLSPRIWFVGVPLLGAMFVWQPNPMLLLIACSRRRSSSRPGSTTRRRPRTRATTRSRRGAGSSTSALYFGLAAYLAFMTYRTHSLISPAAS